MNRTSVLDGLTRIFRKHLDNPEITLSESTTDRDIPEWDSFNHIALITAAEVEFNVRFNTREVAHLQNVGELVDLVLSKMAH